VSALITLTLRTTPGYPVDADGIIPHRLRGLSESEIAALPLGRPRPRTSGAVGSHPIQPTRGLSVPTIGDLFTIEVGDLDRWAAVSPESRAPASAVWVRMIGDLGRFDGVGAAMADGLLTVEGRVGRDLGRGMTGGQISVQGKAGDGVGRVMSGGTVSVRGRVGDAIGGPLPGGSRGMTGGQILALGGAGRDAGFCARRGLILIAGDAEDGAGRAMIAGTIVIVGKAHGSVGLWNRRGTVVVVLGPVRIPETYRYACTYRPSFIGLLFEHLRRTQQLLVDDQFVTGRYARHCGDLSELGRGEVLTWVGA
jgi:formylmethanofuran dehydrogenase subunit C